MVKSFFFFRQLKKEKGLLADPDPKKGRPLPKDISERIVQYSRMCPGKKAYVTIKDQNSKEYKQKQLLLAVFALPIRHVRKC